MSAKGEYYPVGPNMYVENCNYAADVSLEGRFVVELTPTAMEAVDDDAILSGQSIATAGSTTTFATAYTGSEAQMGKFGRALQVVASGAATSTVTVTGFDYLGQPMKETMTLNGATAVNGLKAFRRVTKVEWEATSGTTIKLGTRNALGLPYAAQGTTGWFGELVDDATPTAGALTAAVRTTPSATTGDPRGTYAPHSSALPDGSRKYKLSYNVWKGDLYGKRHYFA